MDLRSRLLALIAARVIVGTLLLGSAFFVQLSRPGVFPVDPFFVLIAIVYALSLAYYATLRLVDRHRWLVNLQLGTDAVLVAGFIGLTGGIVSYFSSLFVLPIIAASTIRFRRGALQVAALSALLYVALVAAQYMGAVPFWLGELRVADGTIRPVHDRHQRVRFRGRGRCCRGRWPTACNRPMRASRTRRSSSTTCAP